MKTALVTGGTRGIGLSVVQKLVAEGYLVTALYASNEEDAERARALCGEAAFVKADVSSEEEVRAAIEPLPCLDVLVCNAGVSRFGQVQDVGEEDYRAVMDVNFGGMLWCCKHGVKKMLGRPASIVAVSSVWGECGGSCESLYSASKGAMIAFSKALAKELAPAGITVNCLAPGVIDTRMNASLTGEARDLLVGEIPLGRMGRAEEVAEAVMFLIKNRYITGQVLGVNGGFRI